MAVFSALAALTTWATTALVSVGFTAAAAAAGANFIIGTGLSLISSLAFGQKTPKLTIPDGQAVLNQTTGPRSRGYGVDKVGGTRAFFDSADGRLHQIIMLNSGFVSEFVQFWVGDTRVALDVNGDVTTPPFTRDNKNHVRILTRAGRDDSEAYAGIMEAFPSVWTAEHRLRGIATIYARFRSPKAKSLARVFPDGYRTEITAVVRLSEVYDPRTGLTAWSDNPGLCIRDYLAHPDGFPGITAADVNDASFAAFADICDQLVLRKDGTTEKRYRLWGTYSLQDDPADILRAMRLCCDAELYEDAAGLICIRGGAWSEPVVTIDDRDVLSFDMTEGNDQFAAFNELKIVFKDPRQNYKSNEAPKWVNLADQARRGPVVEDITLPFCPSPSQAQRLAKIHERKRNPRWRGTISTNLVGLKARGERVIRLRLPEIGIDGTFLVETHGIRGDLTGCDMSLIALDATAYAWNAATEEGDASPEPGDTRPDSDLEIPAGLVLTVETRRVTSATTSPVVVARVAEPAGDGLELDAEIRLSPDGPWLDMAEDELTAVSSAVVTAETYDVRARWITASDTVSDWSAPVTITI